MSSDSYHSSNPIDQLSFTGEPNEDVSIFLRDVKRVAIRQGELDDDDWIKHYVESCLSGTALYWFLELDDDALESWRSIQRAFVRRFASRGAAPAPTPAQPAQTAPSVSTEGGDGKDIPCAGFSPEAKADPEPTTAHAEAEPEPEPEPAVPPTEPEPASEPEPAPIVPHRSPFYPCTFKTAKEVNYPNGPTYLMVGDSGVGKSCAFARRSELGWIPSMLPTDGVDYLYRSLGLMHFWDFSGADRYESLREQYYPHVMSITIAYDVTNRKSFENIRTWVRKIRRHTSKARLELVGYKTDLVDQIVVSEAEHDRLAKEFGMTSSSRQSSKTGENRFQTHFD